MNKTGWLTAIMFNVLLFVALLSDITWLYNIALFVMCLTTCVYILGIVAIQYADNLHELRKIFTNKNYIIFSNVRDIVLGLTLAILGHFILASFFLASAFVFKAVVYNIFKEEKIENG